MLNGLQKTNFLHCLCVQPNFTRRRFPSTEKIRIAKFFKVLYSSTQKITLSRSKSNVGQVTQQGAEQSRVLWGSILTKLSQAPLYRIFMIQFSTAIRAASSCLELSQVTNTITVEKAPCPTAFYFLIHSVLLFLFSSNFIIQIFYDISNYYIDKQFIFRTSIKHPINILGPPFLSVNINISVSYCYSY